MTDALLWQIELIQTSDGRFCCALTSADGVTHHSTDTEMSMIGALKAATAAIIGLHPQQVLRQIQAEQAGQRELLNTILSTIQTETLRDIQQETDMAKKLAEIVTDMEKNAADQIALITEQTTVIQGVEVHLQGQAAVIAGLKQQVKELIEAGGDPAQLAKLEQLAAAMDAAEAATKANTDKVTAAILANTEDGGSPA